MIRDFHPHDLERIMQLWLEGNLDAHSFVPEDYWRSNAPMVRKQLPQAKLCVYEASDGIQGFAGVQDSYLAGIFVDRQHRSMGIGAQLLDHVKKHHPAFTLHVYRRNVAAVAFYTREGLSVVAEDIDVDTGEYEYSMAWPG